MAEFCDKDFIVIWGNSEKITKKTLGEILPFGFDKTNLKLGEENEKAVFTCYFCNGSNLFAFIL
jgi:hypothetical protein